MKKIISFAIPLLMLTLAGCSSAKITSRWNEPQQTPAHFNKVLVVSLFDDNNRVLRQQMEDQLVQELKQDGINAVSALNLYGPKSFQKMTGEQAMREVKSQDFDGVITIGLVDKNKERTYIANPDYYRPYGGWFYRPWGYVYRPYYMPGFRSGHYETSVNYVFETNMYDIHSKQLIYSVQTQSNNPSSVYSLADDYSRSLIKDIRKNNILG